MPCHWGRPETLDDKEQEILINVHQFSVSSSVVGHRMLTADFWRKTMVYRVELGGHFILSAWIKGVDKCVWGREDEGKEQRERRAAESESQDAFRD